MVALLLALKFIIGLMTVIFFFILIYNFYRIRSSIAKKHRTIFLIFLLFGIIGILSSVSFGLINKQQITNKIVDTANEKSIAPHGINKMANLTDIFFGIQQLVLFIFLLKLFKEYNLMQKPDNKK
jgi:hypothetical protein